ncbi:hypothetical protein AB4Z22_33315 [Paenibacillus sp. TAF58]
MMNALWTKDRKWVILSLGLTLLIVLFGIWTMFQCHLSSGSLVNSKGYNPEGLIGNGICVQG